MRILITGAGGQIGTELVQRFADHEVIATRHAELDVADREAVLAGVTGTQPDVILHAAAWTAVDACESDPDRAFAVNALGVRHVAEASRRAGAYLVMFSTDYVFDGTKDDPYQEWDQTNPNSVYGQSKLAGEFEAARWPHTAVLRISWVCGRHGANMAKTVLRLADTGSALRFVDDQRGNPTFAPDVADAVCRLVADRRPGLFHLTNQGSVSWYEFARAVMEAAGRDPDQVHPIATSDLDPPRPAPRPANSVLDNLAWRLSGLPLLPHFRESLEKLVAELLTDR